MPLKSVETRKILPPHIVLIAATLMTIGLLALPNQHLIEATRFASIVDGASSVAVIMASAFMIGSYYFNGSECPGIAYGLMLIGFVRFLSSAVDGENEIVWLHRLCSLYLSSVLCLGSVSRVKTLFNKSSVPWLFIFALAAALIAAFFSNLIPLSVVNHKTTFVINVVTSVSSLLFMIAAYNQWRRYFSGEKSALLFFGCSLFSVVSSGVYFLFRVWSLQWWSFQVIELGVSIGLATSTYLHHVKELRNNRESLSEHNLIMEKTLALVSHDICNPLTATTLAIQEMVKSKNDPEKNRRLLAIMLQNVRHIETMTHSLLDVARMRSGKIVLKFIKCDLAVEINQMILQQTVCRQENIRASINGPILGRWALSEIQRALDNLVSNAAKYGAPNSTILISLSFEFDYAKLSVHNVGRPIAQDEQTKIFEAFHRSKCSESEPVKGWGLGLAFVKGVAEAHRGFVNLVSNSSEGTTFSLAIRSA